MVPMNSNQQSSIISIPFLSIMCGLVKRNMAVFPSTIQLKATSFSSSSSSTLLANTMRLNMRYRHEVLHKIN